MHHLRLMFAITLLAMCCTASAEQPYVGIAQFARRAQLTFGVPGRVSKMLVEEGDTVEEGQFLASLWDEVAVAERNEATERAESTGALLVAQSEYKSLRSEYDSVVSANKNSPGAFSTRHLMQLEYSVQRADHAMQRERDSLTVLRAARESAEKRLASLSLNAPFSGTIVRRFKSIGEGVDSSAPVLELVDSRRVRVEFFLDESDAARVSKGTILQISSVPIEASEPSRQAMASVGFVDLSVQSVRGVVRVWAELDRPEWIREGTKVMLKSGLSAPSAMSEKN